MRNVDFWADKLHLRSAQELLEASVSPLSRWMDEVWYFENPTAGQRSTPSTAKWAYLMPDGSYFHHSQWDELRDASKRLLWSLLTDSRTRSRYKPGSIEGMNRALRVLVHFMVERDYRNFGELDAAAFDDYAEYVVDQVRRRAEVANADYKEPSEATLAVYLRAATFVWRQAPALKQAGLPTPADPPWQGISVLEKARQLTAREEGQIPPVSDEVFCPAMNEALVVLDGREDIVREVLAFYDAVISPSLDKTRGHKRLDNREIGSLSADLSERAVKLSDACLVLLQGTTGLRSSEVCGLLTDNSSDGEWPSCVKIRKSVSGLHEIFVITGRVFKTTRSWIDVEWIVGARPVGSTHIPIPVQAVSVLDRLYRPWRVAQNLTCLFVSLALTRGLPTRVRRGYLDILTDSQQRHLRTCGMKGSEITTHQWRKTFAQYVIRTDQHLLPALKDHFKHLSVAMTEEGYINADPEMRQLLDDARIQNTVEFVGDIVTGRRKVYGPLGEHFEKLGRELGMRLGNRRDEERRGDIEELVHNSGMRLYTLGGARSTYGHCLFRSGTARCVEGCSVGWAMRTPLWTAAQPSICWECANLVPDNSHKVFWVERLEKVRSAIAAAVSDGHRALELLCRQREAQTLMVLSQMGEAVGVMTTEGPDAS